MKNCDLILLLPVVTFWLLPSHIKTACVKNDEKKEGEKQESKMKRECEGFTRGVGV